jgi:hypothetical protein
MKAVLTLYFMVACAQLNAQSSVAGHYRDYFGSSLNIDPDSTFEYLWHFDLMASWTRGEWRMEGDTIYFTMIPVYDTVGLVLEDGKVRDSLVLSNDEKPGRITLDPNTLNSGGQNTQSCPVKLFHRKNRLYEIDENGKLDKKWHRGLWSKREWPPWFIRDTSEP